MYNELSDYQILSRKWFVVECTKWLIHIDDVYPLCPVLLLHFFICIIELVYNICTVFNMLTIKTSMNFNKIDFLKYGIQGIL